MNLVLMPMKANLGNGLRKTCWHCALFKRYFWEGKDGKRRVQTMKIDEGLQKGLKRVLEERQVNMAKMHKADMIKVLQEMQDFKFQRTKVVLCRGHRVMFIPVSL